MKRITLGLVICLFFSQCVEIFDGDFTSSGSDRIVITGGITNLEPPEVRIYTSVAFADKDKAPGPVNDAQVWIEDQDGLKIEMRVANDVHERKLVFFANSNPEPEQYETDIEYQKASWDIDTLIEKYDDNYRYEAIDQSVRGEIGKSYTLFITLNDGRRYQSSPQLLTSSPPITNALAEYEKGQLINQLGHAVDNHKWNIIVETSIDQNQDKFLSWRYKGIYEFETFPEEYCFQEGVDCGLGIDHPREVAPGCCKFCYVTEYGDELATATITQRTSNHIRQQIGQVPIDFYKLYNYYQLDIYQLSISQEVYEYMEELNSQIKSKGSIFDAAPASINGNISNIANEKDVALGIFYAAGVETRRLILNQKNIASQLTPRYYANDCRLASNSTVIKPDGYMSSKENLCYFHYTRSWNKCDMCFDMVTNTFSKCPQ